MNNDNCLIVGGGITGCISAIYLAKQGASVTLCEASGYLGGILRDQEFSGGNFYSSCQYLSDSEEWFKLLPASITEELIIFEHRYGSVSDFAGARVVSDELAVPVFSKGSFDFDRFGDKLNNRSLSSRLSFYPDSIGKHLHDWASRFTIDPDQLCGENACALHIGRIYLADEDQTTARLKANPDYDDTLALPLTTRDPGKKINAAVPGKGYNRFFELLETYLKELDVLVLKDTPVKVRQSGNTLTFHSRKQELKSPHHLVWACNPNPMLAGLGCPTLDNMFGKAVTHYYSLSCKLEKLDPFYIQVFSDAVDISRIYLYKTGNSLKLSVECISGSDSSSDIIKQVKNILLEFGIGPKTDNCSEWIWHSAVKGRLYIFYSESDKSILEGIMSDQTTSACNIVDAGWLQYGRDAKINKILSQFN